MIRGDSSDYELLEKWTKGFDCQGYKTCEIGVLICLLIPSAIIALVIVGIVGYITYLGCKQQQQQQQQQ